MIHCRNVITLFTAALLLQMQMQITDAFCTTSIRGVSFLDTPRSKLRVVTVGDIKDRVNEATLFLGNDFKRRWDGSEQQESSLLSSISEDLTETIVNNHAQQSLGLVEEEEDKGSNDVFLARVLVLCSAALYGTNFTFVKILTESVPIGAMTSLRFFLASLFTFYWLVPKEEERNNGVDLNGAVLAGLEVGFWNSIGYVGQAVGLQTTDAGKSAFICALAVVIVPILDAFTGKKMSPKAMVGASMALGGVTLLELGDSVGTAMTFSPEDLASYLQPFMFGLGFWRMEHAMRKFPSQASRITAAQLFAVFVVSTLYCLSGFGGVAPPDMHEVMQWVSNPSILASLAWTGLITTALTIYMETIALKSLSAAETTLLFSTEPLWGAAFASFVLSETLGLNAGFGAALILSGIYVTNIKSTQAINNESEL